MDAVIPSEMAGAMELDRRARARRRSRYSVRWEDGELPVLELTPDGFVIEAESPPPLRGFTDIFLGDERVLHGLVMCTWAQNGLVGYEFKRGSAANEVRADHAPPVHAGLLTSG